MCCRQLLAAGHPLAGGDGSQAAHLGLAPELTAASEARRFVGEAAPGVDLSVAEDIRLLTSELVTNAVVHAGTAIEVGVCRVDGDLLVAVCDMDPSSPAPRHPDDAATSGRGLPLVTALASEWGILNEDDGKTVWFVVRDAWTSATG